jgi:hypothetical protein
MARLRRGCSKLLSCEVIRSPQDGGGPRLRVLVGRGLPISWLSFLGGDTLVLDCFDLVFSRVFSVKCRPLFSNSRFLERVVARGFLQIVFLPL